MDADGTGVLTGTVGRAHIEIGVGEMDDAVKTAGSYDRIIQHARPVGGRNEDNALVVLEAVHLREQLVDGLDRVCAHSGQVSAGMPSQG